MHNTQGKLQAKNINYIWNKLCKQAGIEGKPPHSARHYIGRKLGLKLGASAVQKELNHKSAATSLQYINIKKEEIK